MAVEQANEIVNGYIQGIQTALQRNQQKSDEGHRLNQEKFQQQQLAEQSKQHAQQINIATLAHQSSLAQLQLQQLLNADKLAESMKPTSIDNSGMGTYNVDLATGPSTFTAPTAETQQARRVEFERKKTEITDTSEKKKLDAAYLQAMAVSKQNHEYAMTQAKYTADARTHDNNVDNATQRYIASQKNGADQPDGDSILLHAKSFLNGEGTEKDFQQMDPKTKKYVLNVVTNAGGKIPLYKDMAQLAGVKQLADIADRMKNAFSQQSDMGGGVMDVIKSKASGLVAPLTNRNLKAQFDTLEGDLASVSKTIGGEAGQRLSNYVLDLQRGAHSVSLSDTKQANTIKYNNFVNKVNEVLKESVLSNYPAKQRAKILENRGITFLQTIGPDSEAKPQSIPSGNSSEIDWSQFDKRKAK